MQRSKILHIIDSLAHGGAEHQLVLNLSVLDKVRFENYVCYLRPVEDVAGALSSLSIHAFSLGVKGRGQWLSSLLRLFRFLRAQKIDLVHTTLFEADFLGGAAGWLAGVPVITTFTALESMLGARLPDGSRRSRGKVDWVWWQKRMLMRRLKWVTYRTFPSYYIALSEPVARTWAQSFGLPQDRIRLIPRALPAEWQQPEPDSVVRALRAELCLDEAYPVLLNVGRLVPQKGQSSIVLAMPDILREFPRAKLLLVGDGTYRGELEGLRKKLRLEERVRFLGKRGDIKALLQLSDMFVLPSLTEGFGVALLEAAALGKPCVASDKVRLAQDIISDGESGLLIDPRSPESLAQAAIRLASKPEQSQAMGRRVQQTVRHRFKLESSVAQLETLYEEALREKRPARWYDIAGRSVSH